MLAGVTDTDAGGGVALDVVEHGLHGELVRVEQSGIAGQPPPHRQRLRGRERRVEPGDGTDEPTLAVDPIDERVAELASSRRIVTGEQHFEVIGRDAACQSHRGGAPADPVAFGIGPVAGQVAGVVARRCRSAVGVDRGHAQHGALPFPLAGTCLFRSGPMG